MAPRVNEYRATRPALFCFDEFRPPLAVLLLGSILLIELVFNCQLAELEYRDTDCRDGGPVAEVEFMAPEKAGTIGFTRPEFCPLVATAVAAPSAKGDPETIVVPATREPTSLPAVGVPAAPPPPVFVQTRLTFLGAEVPLLARFDTCAAACGADRNKGLFLLLEEGIAPAAGGGITAVSGVAGFASEASAAAVMMLLLVHTRLPALEVFMPPTSG